MGGGGGVGMKNEDLGGKCRRGKEKRTAFSGIMLNLVDVLMRFQSLTHSQTVTGLNNKHVYILAYDSINGIKV